MTDGINVYLLALLVNAKSDNLLDDILRKHGAEGDELLGQAQFANLLQAVLQGLADALALKPIVVIQDIKVIYGSKIKQVNLYFSLCVWFLSNQNSVFLTFQNLMILPDFG